MSKEAGASVASAPALKQAIQAFMEGYSIEVTPHDRKKLPEIGQVVPKGAEIYVAHPPGMPIDDVVDMSLELGKLGYTPVPHLIARKVDSRARLEEALGTLRDNGVDTALCIAGDMDVPGAIFDSSLELLETGLLGQYGFKRVGVAGHPEGSRAIGEERVEKFMHAKAGFAKQAPFEMRFVTQFGFNPQAFTDWEAKTTAAGIDLPIRMGLPGPASLRQLVKFAAMCGVGASARMLMTRTGATANLLKTQAPDGLVLHMGRHKLENPDTRFVGAHFFAFGGAAKTAMWANSVVAGDFEFNRQGTGFDVVSDG